MDEIFKFEIDERLSNLYGSWLRNRKLDPWEVFNIYSILSRGNAQVELDFSLNDQILNVSIKK